jgi:hypothetical protein
MLAVLALVAAIVVVPLVNGPVGSASLIEGSLTQVCVPQGRSNNSFTCTAQLRDGSIQVFVALTPLDPQAPVHFVRYDRRLIGAYYAFRD